MEEKSYLCLQPTYMNEFQCDGSRCKVNCCARDWIIEIDGNTYQRYCGIKSPKERKAITSHIKLKKMGNRKTFEVIRGKKGCPFLREDFLCSIQKTYGEIFLPEVCATYPRIINHLGEIVERGLTLSCSIAAQLILSRREPMEFEQIELLQDRPMMVNKRNMENISLGEHLIDLQYGCISLLQNRKLTIDQRLILMGFFLEEAEKLAANGQADKIPDLAADYASDQAAEGAREVTGTFSLQVKEYLRCMFEMRETLYGKKSHTRYEGDRKYLDVLADLYHLSKAQEETVSLSALQEIYEGYRDTAGEIVKEFSYIFENCMVNEFFINVYPFRSSGSLKENYLYFLMSYKMMEFLTLAYAVAEKERLTEEILIDGLSFFSGRMDHNEGYRTRILDEIQKHSEDMIYFMRALLDGRC